MSSATSIFILHSENEAFIRNPQRKRSDTPPQLGLSPIKTALITAILFIIPSIAILIGVSFYLTSDEAETLSPEINIAIIVGGIAGVCVIIYGVYIIINTMMKASRLSKNGRLLKGKIESIKADKEHLDNEHFYGETSRDYFIILKVEYALKSPKSGKVITGKTRQRYLPKKFDENILLNVGKSCAVYYASDTAHVLL